MYSNTLNNKKTFQSWQELKLGQDENDKKEK